MSENIEIEWIGEAKKLNGRPTKMTEETVKKLLDAFSYSFTDEEACIYADISKKTLYNYCDKFPDFLHQKEVLKKKPNIKAKMNWIKKINDTDYQASKEWLERKARDEFSTKSENKLDHTGELNIKIVNYGDNIK